MFLKKLNLYNTFLHIMLASLSVVIILLINKNSELTEAIEKFNSPQLKEGDIFKPQRLFDLKGNELEMGFKSAGKKLLFIFTTTCPYCKKNLPNWETLNKQLKNRYEIIGISADSLDITRKFVEENEIEFPVYISANPKFRVDNKISGVPQTLIITENKVEKFWLGSLNPKIVQEIINNFIIN